MMELKKEVQQKNQDIQLTQSRQQTDLNHSKEKRQIIRSLFVLAAVAFGIFTAYLSLEILQSTLNKETGINSIVILYCTKIVTSFLGPLIVSKLTAKWTVFLSCLCHSTFVLANFYPAWYILLPAGALVGIATGPLWISINLYLTVLGVKYSNITGTAKAIVLSKWNSLVMLTMPISIIFGNFLSSLILQNIHFGDSEDPIRLQNESSLFKTDNTTIVLSMDTFSKDKPFVDYETTSIPFEESSFNKSTRDYCGPNFCPWMATENSERTIGNLERPDQGAIYVLICVFGLFNLFGVLLTLFGLENLTEEDLQSELALQQTNLWKYVLHYLKSFFNWQFLLLIPAITYIHVSASLMSAMFPRAYVSCFLGVGMIGYVSMSRGVAGLTVNLANGVFGKRIKIQVLLFFALIGSTVLALLFLFWQFVENHLIAVCAAAAIAGASISLNMTQMPAFLGTEFTDKVAVFSFYHFIAGIAMAVGYLFNNYLCVQHQLYIYLSILVLSVPTFVLLNVVLHQNANKQRKRDEMQAAIEEKNTFILRSGNNTDRNQLEFLTASQMSLTFT